MRRFRVFVEGKFNAIFDSIEKARECRKALQSLNFDNIVISVEEEDLPQDTDGCGNDRSKCSCKDWGGCPVD